MISANRMTKMITGLSQYSENPTTGNVTVYSYNENGFLEKTTDPMGNTEYNELFDIYGNILAKTDKNDKTLFYTYGAYGITSEDTREDVKKEVTYNSLGQQIKTSSTMLMVVLWRKTIHMTRLVDLHQRRLTMEQYRIIHTIIVQICCHMI